MNNGKLIIFEGVDGCGKSTHLELAYRELINKGYKVYKTREPGGTEIGEEIRKLLKSNISFSKQTEAYLFATARCEINLLINDLIKDDYIILCDRHFISSYIFQDYNFAYEVNKSCMNLLNNNFNIICFDIDYDTRKENLSLRQETDRFEERTQSKEDYEKIRNDYKNIANSYNGSLINISNRTIEDVHKETMNIIYNIIKE